MPKKINYAAMFTLRSDGRYMGYFRDSSGKRHCVYDRDPAKLYAKIEAREHPAPLSFRQLAELWHDDHAQQVGYKTAESYAAPLRRILDRFGDDLPGDITSAEISAFLYGLAAQNYARRSVQLHRDILNMIFNHAILSGALKVNPVSAVSMPRNLRSEKRTLPPDDAIDAIRQSTSAPFALFALVCLYSGLRRGEALALRYEDIDRASRVIHVSKAVEFIGNAPSLKTPKTAAGTRDVILLDVLADLLPADGSGYIFCDEHGNLLTKTMYRKRWDKYCASIGCDITAHQLRHGYTTMLFEAGVSDKDAQELLGHSNIAVTRNIYTHIRQSHRDETAARLNSFIK